MANVKSAQEVEDDVDVGAGGATAASAVAEAALANARSKVLSKLARRSMMELMLPVLLALKRHLERLHSPLLKSLMLFFFNIVRDFRVEMDDLMAANRQLAQEIEFDLRQFEKQQLEAQQQQQQQALVASPTLASPSLTSPLSEAVIPRCDRSHPPALCVDPDPACAVLTRLCTPRAAADRPPTSRHNSIQSPRERRTWNIASPVRGRTRIVVSPEKC